jgi:hypothetical protein
VWLPPDRQKCSQVALPRIVAPGIQQSGGNGGVVGGTKPSSVEAPFIIGTPGQRDVVLKRHGAAGQRAGRCTCTSVL